MRAKRDSRRDDAGPRLFFQSGEDTVRQRLGRACQKPSQAIKGSRRITLRSVQIKLACCNQVGRVAARFQMSRQNESGPGIALIGKSISQSRRRCSPPGMHSARSR